MTKKRCPWAEDVEEIYVRYHDEEWGEPTLDDQELFEMLVLESFQAGLAWITILKKRENFRNAFDNFDVEKVASYDEKKVEELMNNAGIIRHKGKINAAINNANVFIEIQKEYGSFSNYIWHFTDNKVLIDTEENFKVFQFDFDTEKLNYKFDLEIKPMGGIQKITDIVFIGFCD